jgi:hypothetical protein
VANPATISSHDEQANTAWLAAGRNVVRLDDGAEPKVISLFAADEGVQGLAAGKDGQLYFTQKNEVWSVGLKGK